MNTDSPSPSIRIRVQRSRTSACIKEQGAVLKGLGSRGWDEPIGPCKCTAVGGEGGEDVR